MTSLTKDGVTYYFEYDDEGHKIREIKNGLTTSVVGSILGNIVGKNITKTVTKSNQLYDQYLNKTFTAALRKEAGRSSSALLRQANNLLEQSNVYQNITRGVSSVVGSGISLWNIAR